MLRRGAQRQERKKSKKLAKSEYVEGEAVESDDDAKMGFGGMRKEDDDEDDSDNEDQDKVVEGLVDDAVMDAETEGAEKVLEKHK
jgi:mediator of replication checkpoint protein 1